MNSDQRQVSATDSASERKFPIAITRFAGVAMISTLLASAPLARAISPTVTLLAPQALLPNGHPTNQAVFSAGSRKRIRIQIDPNGTTIGNDVGVDFSFNHRTAIAMFSVLIQRANAHRLNGTPTTRSVFVVDIPGSEHLKRCEWFHFRWSFHFQSGGTPGFFATQTRSFQVLHDAPGTPLHSTTPCNPVP